jgi:phosphoenolpyruvate-protein kinase (PTS system EI component)
MASNPTMIPFLIGIGIRQLSMDTKRIPIAQQAINKVNSRRAVRQAEVMLSMGRISDLTEFLEQQA